MLKCQRGFWCHCSSSGDFFFLHLFAACQLVTVAQDWVHQTIALYKSYLLLLLLLLLHMKLDIDPNAFQQVRIAIPWTGSHVFTQFHFWRMEAVRRGAFVAEDILTLSLSYLPRHHSENDH